MSVAPNTQDRWLEIHQLLPALIDQGVVPAGLNVPANSGLHPLECIASHGPSLETLTEWLARHCGQPYLRIDPLKIDVAAVVPLMSYAFAQRHRILAVAVDSHSITAAT